MTLPPLHCGQARRVPMNPQTSARPSANPRARNWLPTILVLGVFGVLGIFALSLSNVADSSRDLIARRGTTFLERWQAGNYRTAFELVTEEWAATLKDADGLARLVEDGFSVPTAIQFEGPPRTCRVGRAGAQYAHYRGQIQQDGEALDVTIRYRYERGDWRVHGLRVDEVELGGTIPDDCLDSTLRN